jgi:MtrB/PioB family decaheme-associated outer membrane protein
MGGCCAKSGLTMLVLLIVFACGGESLAAEKDPVTDNPSAEGQAVDTSRWLCSLCNYPEGWFGTLDFGPGYVSDSSLKFGDYRGLEEKGFFPTVDGNAHYRDGNGRYFDLYAHDLGIESRQLEMRAGREGRYEVRLAYQEIPRYRGYGARTPFLDAGKTALPLPQDWVHARSTGAMSTLDDSLQDAPLKTKRKILAAGLSFEGDSRWSYEVDFKHQEKKGSRPFGGGVFTINSSHFPAPVDFSTNQFNMGLAYSGARSQIRFGFMGSAFDNGSSSVSWENPFTAIPGTELLRASLEPDNDFYQFNLSGAWSPTPKIRFSGQAAAGRMTQDHPFFPYTTNPNFSDLPLPRPSLDGRIDTSTLNLAGKFSARLSRGLDLTARVKLDEKNNKTPVDLFTPVITDLVLKPARPNRPYSFKREKVDLELRYRVQRAVRLNAGLRRENMERTLQSVAETREDTLWGEISFSQWASAQLRLKLASSDRDASPYLQLEDGGPLEHPLMRKFNMADRKRDRIHIELDLSPAESLSVNLAYFTTEDDYENSVIGLQQSEEQSFSVDISWSINPDLSLYGYANREDIDSSVSSAADLGTAFWSATTRDRFITTGLGIQARVSKKITLGFDYVFSDSEGIVHTDSGLGEEPFPALETELRNARAHISYRVNDRWGWKFLAEHESYQSEDWYVDGLGPDGISSILTMGIISPGYAVLVVRMLATWRF